MKSRTSLGRRIAAAGVLLALFLFVAPATADDPESELERVRDDIAELNEQIEAAEQASEQVAGQVAAALDEMNRIAAEVDEAQGKVDAVEAEIAEESLRRDELLADLEAIEAQLAETTANVADTLARLELQAAELYKNAAAATMGSLVLALDSAADISVGMAYADGVVGDSEDLLDTFEFLRREEDRQRASIDANRKEVEVVIAGLEEDEAELEVELEKVRNLEAAAADEVARVNSLLASIQADIDAAEQHRDGLEAESARLEDEIAAQQSSDDGSENPGVIAWPVSGPVSSPYGYRIHPIFGTRKLHTGIDISVGYGVPITAAESGTVILASVYGGYGNTVVIDHGGGLSTLAAHQSSIAVSNGQYVNRGDVIGYVGCTGYCTGPHLHFETREYGTPVDPMKYLGG